ncbi:MAG: BCCT family transporter, partial [Gammaproteobacteria bacterium]
MSSYRSEHRIGEHNLRWLGFDVHRVVFPVAAAVVVLIVALVIAFPRPAAGVFDTALGFITREAGWLMASLANFFVLFCIFLMVTPYGSVRLGGADARPEFSNISWFAMLF